MTMLDRAALTVLNLGCGLLQKPEAINVDHWPGPGVDVVYDLDRHPWPWPDEAFETVYALDILEHLEDFLAAVQEIHRILRPGGTLHVRTSCWETKQSYTDPTHRRFLTEDTFNFWVPGHWQSAKYPQYHRGRFFQVVKAERSGEELVFALRKI